MTKFILYMFWPVVVMGAFALLFSFDDNTDHLLYGTFIISGVANVIIGVFMLVLANERPAQEQGGGFAAFGLASIFTIMLIFPTIDETKDIKSAEVYQKGTSYYMDVVTVDDDNVTFNVSRKEATKLSALGDKTQITVDLEYMYDRSFILDRDYNVRDSKIIMRVIKD